MDFFRKLNSAIEDISLGLQLVIELYKSDGLKPQTTVAEVDYSLAINRILISTKRFRTELEELRKMYRILRLNNKPQTFWAQYSNSELEKFHKVVLEYTNIGIPDDLLKMKLGKNYHLFQFALELDRQKLIHFFETDFVISHK